MPKQSVDNPKNSPVVLDCLEWCVISIMKRISPYPHIRINPYFVLFHFQKYYPVNSDNLNKAVSFKPNGLYFASGYQLWEFNCNCVFFLREQVWDFPCWSCHFSAACTITSLSPGVCTTCLNPLQKSFRGRTATTGGTRLTARSSRKQMVESQPMADRPTKRC